MPRKIIKTSITSKAILLYFICVSCVIFLFYHFFWKNPRILAEPFSHQRRMNYMPILEKRRKERHFPYRFLQNEKAELLPIVLVSGFFRDEKAKQYYEEYILNDIKVVGITAYKSFPKTITDGRDDLFHLTDDFNYTEKIKNWMCCFSNPRAYHLDIAKHNLIDISESDFYDVDTVNVAKKYDIIYSCLKDDDKCSKNGWNAVNRNYDLALKCLPIMINEFGFKVLFIGRVGCGLEEKYGDSIETTDFMEWHLFQEKLRESRFLFVPNIYDASPRVISESLTKGLPVLMNRSILCGSKYIVEDTGELFTDEHDFRYGVKRLLERESTMDTRKWWNENYGMKRSGKKMRDYLVKCYPGVVDDSKTISIIV
jgi:hypothetical protein